MIVSAMGKMTEVVVSVVIVADPISDKFKIVKGWG